MNRGYRVKITAKGQITLPKNLRETLKVSEGDYLEAYLRGNELVLKPEPRQSGREMLIEYAQANSGNRVCLEEARRILAGLPFSMDDRVRELREKGRSDG